jgi:hypothetical protein
MAKLVVTKPTGERFEISDLSIAEIKYLAGLNGNRHAETPLTRAISQINKVAQTDYHGFFRALTPFGKKFISILRENTQGINAEMLAEKLGFKSTAQIGGLAGGGMGKAAKKHGIDLENVYKRNASSENGVRKVIYFPGNDIGEVK